MEGIKIKDIVTVTGGTLLCGDENKEIKEFSIDSREGNPDSIFVPVIGERVDAHKYIESALKINGATFTQEHDRPLPGCDDKPWIRVEDTVKAMQQTGTFYRDKMDFPVVAVTGSVGKTTTREMIACALSAGKQVYQTRGNQNSQIGVPLTLSHMSRQHEAAVLEIGMSERGQIETLTRMIRPDIAVVTMIGVSHIAQLGSQENIFIEKMDIVKGLPDQGLIFLNGDDPYLTSYEAADGHKLFYYGLGSGCDYRAEDIVTSDGRTSFTFLYPTDAVSSDDSAGKNADTSSHTGALSVTLGTMGEHNVRNALVALGICHQMHVDLTAAAGRLSSFHGQRQQVIHTPVCTLIDDTYNASPDSMKAAVKVLASMEGVKGRRIAGLSDMLELGENEKAYHYEVGTFIAGQQIDEVAVYGELSREMIRGISDRNSRIKCTCFDSREDLKQYLLSEIHAEDVLLLKGSNGIKLKEISEAVQKETGAGGRS